jgi:PAS domain-containing protein
MPAQASAAALPWHLEPENDKEVEMLTRDINYPIANAENATGTVRQATSAGVAVLDMQGCIVYLNAAWRQLIGSRDADAFRIGNHYLTVMRSLLPPRHHLYLQEIEYAMQKVFAGERESIEVEYPHSYRGKWCWFVLRISAHRSEGQPALLLEQRPLQGATRHSDPAR